MTNLPSYAHEIRPLSRIQTKQLLTDLSKARVASRKQGSANLSYLEAWDVKATLIRVFGFGGFSARLTQSAILRSNEVPQRSGDKTNWQVSAQATVELYIHQLGAVYAETAIAGSSQPDWTESADMAIKSAESDALKRAAIYLGTQFGLSLYDSGSLGDVVRVLLSEGEKMVTVESIRAEQAQAAQGQQGGTPAQQAQTPASAPQESEPSDDAPMALAPSDEAVAAAQSKVSGAFGG